MCYKVHLDIGKGRVSGTSLDIIVLFYLLWSNGVFIFCLKLVGSGFDLITYCIYACIYVVIYSVKEMAYVDCDSILSFYSL